MRTPANTRVAALLLIVIHLLAACESGAPTDPGGDPGPPEVSPPDAPSGLVAEPTSTTTVALTWKDNSDNETEFRIQRSPDGGEPWSGLGAVGANTTSYVDTDLQEDTQYFYRVAAVAGELVSGWSNPANTRTLPGTVRIVEEIDEVIESVMPTSGTPLEDRDLLQEVKAVANGLAGLPTVDTVVVLERVLAAQALLKNGMMHLFINNRPAGADTLGGAAGSVGTALPSRHSARARSLNRVDGPPGSPKAVVTSYDGGANLAAEVAGMLGENGYDILSLGASLSDMRQYKDLGVLHLDTHGVAFNRMRRLEDGSIEEEKAYGLQTSTTLGSDLSSIREELLDGSLVISVARDGSGTLQTKIAITEKFIAKHWSFDDGVVMLHACHGGAGPFRTDEGNGPEVDPSILRLTMLGAGARIVVAFDNLTWPSFARPSILHFFDRVLGADSYDPEDPPLRPFDVDQVNADMHERGLLQFTRPSQVFLGVIPWGGNEVNVIFDAVPGRATLAPSIRSFDIVDDVDQGYGKMTLHGLFGAEEGTVEVEGVPVSLEEWSNTTVVAQAPFEGSGSAGPVVVKRPDDVESNEVPLTRWRGTVTVTNEFEGSLKAESTMEIIFRADVHAFRNSIQDDPEHRKVDTYFSPASSGTSKGSGSYNTGEAVETWYGTFDMEILPKEIVDGGVFSPTGSLMGGKATLDPEGGKAEICLGVWGEIGVRLKTSNGTVESTGYGGFIEPSLVDRMRGLFGCVDAEMDDDTFVIHDGDRSASREGAEFTLKWTKFVPLFPPDDQTAG